MSAETLHRVAATMRSDLVSSARPIDIASRPAFALAVADWLDFEARVVERANANYPDHPHMFEADEHALAAANAYLQETP